jgi:hypothetical protein
MSAGAILLAVLLAAFLIGGFILSATLMKRESQDDEG